MGESDRYIEHRGKYRQPGFGLNINSPVVMLVIINFTVFLFVKMFTFGNAIGDTSIAPFFNDKMGALLVPSSFNKILSQPWSIITYSFFHLQFLNLLGNMLWLWGFGSILQTIAGNKKTFPIYLYGAVAGAVAFMAANTILKSTGLYNFYPLQGANAAVMAVAAAATTIAPDYRIFRQIGKGIPIWILTAVYLLVDLAGLGSTAAPLFSAHLAGALIGFLFAYSWRRGYDWGAWMNNFYEWLINLFSPSKKEKQNKVKEKVFYNAGKTKPYTKTANITQERIDEILDKINQKGYQSLNREEKEILKKASEE